VTRKASPADGLLAVDSALTAREREVLALVRDRLDDQAIADHLGIAPSTVAALLRSSMAKLGAQTRVEAAAELTRIGGTTTGEARSA